MGLFEKLFPKKTALAKDAVTYFQTLNAYNPTFISWNGAIYESLQVRSAIDALARHSSKLEMTIQGSAKPALRTKLRRGPNQYQTWSQFLYQARTILEADTTLFIVPVYDRYGEISGVYPVRPSNTTIVEGLDKTIYLKYTFSSGQTAAIELLNCCLLTKFQYDSEFFGSLNGPLKETMELITIQNQGITNGIKNSSSFRFMAQSSNFVDPEDLEKEQTRFSRHLKQKGGFLLFPNTYRDIKQIDSKPYVPDAEQQKLILQNISNYFGVNEDILQNKAVGDAWSAFYEGAIEPFAIQLSEAMTRMLFTFNEQVRGSKVMFTANRLQYMTNKDKLEVSAQMLDRGIMSINDVRDIWNMPHVENGDQRIIRGEYYNADEKLTEVNDGEL